MRNFAYSIIAATLLIASAAQAAGKEYQVTGPVLENSDKAITVQKGSEKWEIAKSGDTKTTGSVAVGDKVTVYYTMSATSIESKAKPAKSSKK